MKTTLPGATIGILGNGQLGRMLALAARRMGYRVATLGPGRDTPCGQVADWVVEADYDDPDAARDFARRVEVVTFEFENIAAATVAAVADVVPVFPGGPVLHTTQNRLREKQFLHEAGIPHAPFAPVSSRADLADAVVRIGLPAVLKTAGFGYDGKGQQILTPQTDLDAVWQDLAGGDASLVLEAFVHYEYELSVVAARGQDGAFAAFPPVRNDHAHHILDLTTAPAPDLPPALAREAALIARTVMETLDVVGVLCVEFFVTTGGKLIVNELAPRPHNSGHWTIEGGETSQFEQQLRAVCGLPLGGTALRGGGAAMANLLGDLWESGPPNWPATLALPGVYLHLYGKAGPRPGRKMGHLTAVADTPADAAARVKQARAALQGE